jgi:hypothetical protein
MNKNVKNLNTKRVLIVLNDSLKLAGRTTTQANDKMVGVPWPRKVRLERC